MNTSSSNHSSSSVIVSALNEPATIRRRAWRMLKDKIVRHSMTFGGLGVIAAILLIFFYLLYVVMPLLTPASLQLVTQFQLPGVENERTLHLAVEEKNELAVRFTDDARAVFFRLQDGHVISEYAASKPDGVEASAFAVSDSTRQVVGYGFANGTAIALQHSYNIVFTQDSAGNRVRTIDPSIVYPLGQDPVTVDPQGQALTHLGVQISQHSNMIAAVTADQRLVVVRVSKAVNFLTEEETLNTVYSEIALDKTGQVTHLLLEKDQRYLYLADTQGVITRYDVREQEIRKEYHAQVVPQGDKITSLRFLTGDISLLVGESNGIVTQWFPVRDANNVFSLQRIREFQGGKSAIVDLAPEERRKGFVAADARGYLGIYHTTAHRTVLSLQAEQPLVSVNLSPRADFLIGEDRTGKLSVWEVHNPHPEVSFQALWGKVWYENYPEPDHIWQSSSATSDFEPKFSLAPLTFGTFKAAFYAMLVAVPIAILGAVYAAYFMSPRIRGVVKPTIEIMEALPTVILGFLAGLWLAPFIEANLPGVFLLLLLLPIGIILSAYLWRFMPERIRYAFSDGWEAALLVIPVLLMVYIAFYFSHPLEVWFFNGNMPEWLNQNGIPFDQRNSIVVGVAMGLAVVPNIFSIAEDAIFSVPRHLTSGSLALGATRWQTMTRVVLLTASPGIFSAVMIGLGRAVGETMIVLMATGNTAVMDFSLFQGLRTLSANIAVEMPESEVGSTHFRVLFLAGLVLFILTFFFNTLAEIVRHRLRRKYSSL
ncbi:ABC transporter permease subunit [Thioflexithrix psekupsensis]|uniref:Phosphate ABC transporter permease n=1 Tax=Thioflexithrix psekupsensis TaxID=1570016 RepID=A0A251XAH4_9GAMM|nr:ABC transporter permease subunit [Thioflexithrix psekupsensis]OUD15431.1 phosphate ABC transporter permease [Thioflexithrix psekupsensis]